MVSHPRRVRRVVPPALVILGALTISALAVELPSALNPAPASVISNGISAVVVWWSGYPSYRIEWSPDNFVWLPLAGGTTANPQAPVVLVENNSGSFWASKFYRLVDTTSEAK